MLLFEEHIDLNGEDVDLVKLYSEWSVRDLVFAPKWGTIRRTQNTNASTGSTGEPHLMRPHSYGAFQRSSLTFSWK